MVPEKWQDPAEELQAKMQRGPVYKVLTLVGTGLFLVGILGFSNPGVVSPISPWLAVQADRHPTEFVIAGLVVYLFNGVAGYLRAKEGS